MYAFTLLINLFISCLNVGKTIKESKKTNKRYPLVSAVKLLRPHPNAVQLAVYPACFHPLVRLPGHMEKCIV